jgi:uncharacterized surface protein with fasciclin (FAS1) repeats
MKRNAETTYMGSEASRSDDARRTPANGAKSGASPQRGRSARPKTRAAERETGWRPKENVLEVAANLGRFNTFSRAVTSAGLTSQLSGNGPFTVFAPTDKAFAKIPTPELEALLGDAERLTKLLACHVVPATVRAPRRTTPTQITTLGGNEQEIRVVPEDGGYQIGDARIVKTNIRASNGVVHAIDTVLEPR